MGEISALMSKNWLLYKRGCCANIAQIIFPCLIFLVVLFFSTISPPEYYPEQSFLNNVTYRKTFDNNTKSSFMKNCPANSVIALAPSSSILVALIDSLLTNSSVQTQTYGSQRQMQDFIRSSIYSSSSKQICCAIIIQSQSAEYRYKLRFNTSTLGLSNIGPQTSVPPLTRDVGIDLKSYQTATSSGMIGANYIVNNQIFQREAGSNKYLQQQMAPAYQQQLIKDTIYQNLYRWIDFIFLLPLLIVYTRQTYTMLSQKQAKVRQSMRIMGMKMKNYYFTWFVRYFITYSIIHGVAIAIIIFQLPYIPYYIPLGIFLLFDALIIIQNFFVQIFFSRTRLGISIAILFFIFQYGVCYIVSNTNPEQRFKTFLSAVPHVAFVFAFQNLFYFQSQKITASLFQSVNSYTLITAVFSLTANIVFYLLLLWYFDRVIPDQWGQSKNPCFCFCGTNPAQRKQQAFNRRNMDYHERSDTEQNTIEIVCHKQSEGNKLIQEDKTYLKLYKDQVFVLYGHNGSGKTSIISALCGIIQPHQGWRSVFKQNQIHVIQKGLGFCHQQSILYEQLTVTEQLNIFMDFKEVQKSQVQSYMTAILSDFQLTVKKDQFIKNLQEWQKKKLSIAMSFAGKSKLIILDEPTYGMDTIVKKNIWDIIHKYKKDRAIIVTSHLIEQAYSFGDRIGIMKESKLICCGSSTFLRQNFGLGYKVTFVKRRRDVDSERIIRMIKGVIPNVSVVSNVGFELSIHLPLRQLKYYQDLFDEIDRRQNQLQIEQYGVNMANLQEIFLAVDKKPLPSENHQIIYPEKHQELCIRFLLHFKATFMKKIIILKKDTKSLFLQILVPIFIILGTCYFIKPSYINDVPPQTINTRTYLSEQNPVFLPVSSSNVTLLASINSSLINHYGPLIQVSDSTDVVSFDFDKNHLLPWKKSKKTLKGGIYFEPSTTSGTDTKYSFYSLCITKSSTSYLFLPSLATQTLINSQFGKNISITVIDHPLPLSYDQLSIGTVISGFLGAFLFTLAFSFKFSSTISFLVRQRQEKLKFLQLLNGMSISAYWSANFVYDVLVYLILAGTAINYIFHRRCFSCNNLLIRIFWDLLSSFDLYLCILFRQVWNCSASLLFLNYLYGRVTPWTYFCFQICFFELQLDWKTNSLVSKNPSCLCVWGNNHKSLQHQHLQNILKQQQDYSTIFTIDFPCTFSLFSWWFLSIFHHPYLNLVLLKALSILRLLLITQSPPPLIGQDLVRQQNNVLHPQAGTYSLIANRLQKKYASLEEASVKNLSLALQRGDFFGLLGTKNAGKTTAFKLLHGQISPTFGRAFLNDQQVNQRNTRGKIGYCPQQDNFVETLSVRQHLQLFYSIKSLRNSQKRQCIQSIIYHLGLKDYEYNIASTLSRGNKRKLSVAIALLGKQDLILLDQPSAGMDPVARQLMWRLVSQINQNRQLNQRSTVVLATKSLQEAEALSNRLAIMHNGNLRCIGPTQQIKRRYGDGIEIEIKLKPEKNLERIIQHKGLQNIEINNNVDLNQILVRLNANPQQRRQIREGEKGRHIRQMLDKSKPVLTSFIYQYLRTSFIFHKIHQQIAKIFDHLNVRILNLQQKQYSLTIKTDNRPKISQLFNLFQNIKQLYAIQHYQFKQTSVSDIFQKFTREQRRR